jgi:hypothetical protein
MHRSCNTHAGKVVHIRADDREGRDDIEESRSLLKLGKDKQRQQKCADDVNSDGALIATGCRVVHRVDSGILDDCVEALESLNALGKCFDVVIILQVKIPDFDHTFATSRLFNIFGGSFAFGSGARGQDHAVSIESDKVAYGFLSQSRVCARHDNRVTGAVGGRVGRCSEDLVVETLAHGTHCCVYVGGGRMMMLCLRVLFAMERQAAFKRVVAASLTCRSVQWGLSTSAGHGLGSQATA